MASSLYNRVNYKSNIDYISSALIYEYDIERANTSILYSKNIIDFNTFNQLNSMKKEFRNINIGLFLKDNKEAKKVLANGIIEAKKNLFLSNNIEDKDVLAIKNDAVFTVNKRLNITEFGDVKFKLKNTYVSYYNILNKEFYYYINTITGETKLDIKGFSDMVVNDKRLMLDFIIALLESAQLDSIDITMNMLRTFHINYLNRTLDRGYYRRIDNGLYNVVKMSNIFNYTTDAEIDMDYIDISYNNNILIEFNKIFSSIYFQTKR